jgi:hypothetical protein
MAMKGGRKWNEAMLHFVDVSQSPQLQRSTVYHLLKMQAAHASGSSGE